MFGRKVEIVFFDTATQEAFHAVRPFYFRLANVALFCFDITSRESFDDLDSWHDRLLNSSNGPCTKVVLGLKLDLADRRVVSSEEGALFASSIGAHSYAEVSAKNGFNVDEPILAAVSHHVLGFSDRRGSVRLPSTVSMVELGSDDKLRSVCYS